MQPSPSGPARKYYVITDQGDAARLTAVRQWRDIRAIAELGLTLEGSNT
ncbi:MAG: hypothetical protein WBX27_19220 [Specibacter sp.]